MKEKYINEKFGIFYDAGDLFYRLNGKDERCISVSSMPQGDVKIIVEEYNKLLEEYKEIFFELEKLNRKKAESIFYK